MLPPLPDFVEYALYFPLTNEIYLFASKLIRAFFAACCAEIQMDFSRVPTDKDRWCPRTTPFQFSTTNVSKPSWRNPNSFRGSA